MDVFEKHEQFEMQVLASLQSAKLLEKLVFGGGTMLRLCHELNRYSVDMDFYLKHSRDTKWVPGRLRDIFSRIYDVRDFMQKRNTILAELSHGDFPRKLKVEINTVNCYDETEQSIAWSKHANIQVLVTAISLSKMMELKINALIDRKEIRDAFDFEFLIRRGITADISTDQIEAIKKVIGGFKPADYKVKLGSIVSAEDRKYYNENGFSFLTAHLNLLESRH